MALAKNIVDKIEIEKAVYKRNCRKYYLQNRKRQKTLSAKLKPRVESAMKIQIAFMLEVKLSVNFRNEIKIPAKRQKLKRDSEFWQCYSHCAPLQKLLMLCDIRTKIDAQRVRWLVEALNSQTDSIEYYLISENLGVQKHHALGEIKASIF